MGKTNITFKNLTTLKVGGKIKFFKEVNSEDEVVDAIEFAKKNNLKTFIIGGGSDIAPSDNDFDGLVLRYTGDSFNIKKNKNGEYLVSAEAGMNWDDLVKKTVRENLQGIECLSAIPGSVGASPIQNIGAYGQDLSETFVQLTAYDIEKQKFVIFKNQTCKFGYRESIFKTKKYWQKFLITKIVLKLKKYTDKELSLQTIRDEIIRVRSEKLEDPRSIPNAGSFFKNPLVKEEVKDKIIKMFPEMKVYKEGQLYKLSAGFLIEKAGWKGKALGKVKVSDKHALILTNPDGRGNFSDIKKLADAITDDVYNKFGITLEPEVQYINI